MKGNTGVIINLLLKNLPQEVAEEVVKRTVEKAATIAKQFVRVDLGNLKGSITPESRGTNGVIYSESDYSLAQEFGMPGGRNNQVENTVPAGGGNGYTFSPYMRPAATIAGSQEEVDKSTTAAMRRYNNK
jgi:hypothetical protein